MLPVQALPLHAVGRQNFSCSEPLAQSDYSHAGRAAAIDWSKCVCSQGLRPCACGLINFATAAPARNVGLGRA